MTAASRRTIWFLNNNCDGTGRVCARRSHRRLAFVSRHIACAPQCYPNQEQPSFRLRASTGATGVDAAVLGSLRPAPVPGLAAWTAQLQVSMHACTRPFQLLDVRMRPQGCRYVFTYARRMRLMHICMRLRALQEIAGGADACGSAYTKALDDDREAKLASEHAARAAGGAGGVGACQKGGSGGASMGATPAPAVVQRLAGYTAARDACVGAVFGAVVAHFAPTGFDLPGATAAAVAASTAARVGILGHFTTAMMPDRLLQPIETVLLSAFLGPAYWALPAWQADFAHVCANASVAAALAAAYGPPFANACTCVAAACCAYLSKQIVCSVLCVYVVDAHRIPSLLAARQFAAACCGLPRVRSLRDLHVNEFD